MGPIRLCMLDRLVFALVLCVQQNQGFSWRGPYLCFVSFLYPDLYVLGDDALIS